MDGIQCVVLKVYLQIILDSSMVEHTTVNRGVVGSSPTRGVKKIGLLGQAVKTSPFHGGNTGSIPVGVTSAGADSILIVRTLVRSKQIMDL